MKAKQRKLLDRLNARQDLIEQAIDHEFLEKKQEEKREEKRRRRVRREKEFYE